MGNDSRALNTNFSFLIVSTNFDRPCCSNSKKISMGESLEDLSVSLFFSLVTVDVFGTDDDGVEDDRVEEDGVED